MVERAETRRKPLADWQTGEPPYQLDSLPIGVLRRIESIVHLQHEQNSEPRTLEKMNKLLPKVNRLVSKYFDALRPFKDPDRNWWSEAKRTAMFKAKDKAYDLGRGRAWHYLEDSHLFGSPFMRWMNYNSSKTEDAAKWETVVDQEGFKNNPNISLLRIYKLARLKIDWAMVSIEGRDLEEMMILRGPLGDVDGFDDKKADAVQFYTEAGSVSDKVEFVVDHSRDVNASRLLVPPVRIEFFPRDYSPYG